MKIVAIDVFQQTYNVLPGPFTMSGGRVVSQQESTIVRIAADSGEVGWGEQCSFSPAYLPGHAAATHAAMPLLAAAVLGCDPRQVELVHERMDAALVGQNYAKSPLDIACWDLFGRSTGLRVSELLGGTRCEDVALYKAVSLGDPSTMAERAAEIRREGYRLVQLKVGDGWQDDLRRVVSCVDRLGDVDRIIVDANGRLSQHEAARLAWHLSPLDVYLEQPCATTRECGEVRRQSGKPMVLDESLSDFAALLDALEARALDAARLKLSRFGGITPLRKARDLCQSVGVGVSVEDSAGGDVVSAAIVHLAASMPASGRFDAFLPSGEVGPHIAHDPVVPHHGRALVPVGPGLGVEVDVGMLGRPLAQFR